MAETLFDPGAVDGKEMLKIDGELHSCRIVRDVDANLCHVELLDGEQAGETRPRRLG